MRRMSTGFTRDMILEVIVNLFFSILIYIFAEKIMVDYSKRTYEELQRDWERVNARFEEIQEECLKDGVPYREFCEKAHKEKEELYFIDKYMRLKKEPTIEYGKTWKGDMMTLDEFKEHCRQGLFTDGDGYGEYATETSKSDVEITPSDVLENILREDFPYVIWFSN